jgi:glyoxalase-like protein
MLELDHILWAAPHLDEGARLFEALTGVRPAGGGSHPGFGTRNQLASLGDGAYFEIIAPDPAQDLAGNRGGAIAALPHPGLMTFAVRGADLAGARRTAQVAGLAAEGPIAMHRTRPDGVRLNWSVLFLRDPALGEAIPFAIHWGCSPHPSGTTPGGCRLRSFAALQPEPERLASIYGALGLAVEVKRAARPGFLAMLDTPRGEVVLTSP